MLNNVLWWMTSGQQHETFLQEITASLIHLSSSSSHTVIAMMLFSVWITHSCPLCWLACRAATKVPPVCSGLAFEGSWTLSKTRQYIFWGCPLPWGKIHITTLFLFCPGNVLALTMILNFSSQLNIFPLPIHLYTTVEGSWSWRGRNDTAYKILIVLHFLPFNRPKG